MSFLRKHVLPNFFIGGKDTDSPSDQDLGVFAPEAKRKLQETPREFKRGVWMCSNETNKKIKRNWKRPIRYVRGAMAAQQRCPNPNAPPAGIRRPQQQQASGSKRQHHPLRQQKQKTGAHHQKQQQQQQTPLTFFSMLRPIILLVAAAAAAAATVGLGKRRRKLSRDCWN